MRYTKLDSDFIRETRLAMSDNREEIDAIIAGALVHLKDCKSYQMAKNDVIDYAISKLEEIRSKL